jgi:hypothetical protein
MPFAVVIEYDNQCYSSCLLGVGDSQYECDMLKLQYCRDRFGSINTALGELESGYFFSVHELSQEVAEQVSDFLRAHRSELYEHYEVPLHCPETKLSDTKERRAIYKLIFGADSLNEDDSGGES